MMMNKASAIRLDAKAVQDEGEFEGYASTFGGEPDAYGDVIAEGAFTESLANHAKRGSVPRMFWEHERKSVIGRWSEMSEDSKGLHVRGKLSLGTQEGRTVHELLKDGALDTMSIGYRLKSHEVDDDSGIWTLTKLDLVEVSVVSIPANENATVTSVKALKSHHAMTQRLKAGEQLTERELEQWLKGLEDGFSNSEAERAVSLHFKRQGVPASADSTSALIDALANTL